MGFLNIIKDILSEPAFLMGLTAMVGLIILRKPAHKVVTDTLGPISGHLMSTAGANVIVTDLDPLSQMIRHGFNITGVVPSNEAITSVAQKVLGVETMSILLVGLIFNLIIAGFTKYKYIFLTGHHSFFMACLLSATLGVIGFKGVTLVTAGGFILGAWSTISPATGQKYTLKATDGDEIAIGHFGSLEYYLSVFIGSLVGKDSKSTEDIETPEKWSFLRNTTISTVLTTIVFYLIASIKVGLDFIGRMANDRNPYLFAITSALNLSVGVAVVYAGVRVILADLILALKGIAMKLIPNSVPTTDCTVFLPYAPTAVILGFACSFVGGLVGMLILGTVGGVLVIPGPVPHFFCGATAGIYGNATGGRRGAMIGSFTSGLFLVSLPAFLLLVLGQLGFNNTTFEDSDFGVLGTLLGKIGNAMGNVGVYIIIAILAVVLIAPSITTKKNTAVNNEE